MNVYEKLMSVQAELKAPKGQYNSFGKYKYRSCEDILESLKPVLNKFKLTIMISDDVVEVNARNYIKATVTLINIEKPDEQVQVTALAREEESKKGMDGSQITGASSSYARKYALNGMFAIDDTKDSDGTNTHGKEEKKEDNKEKAIKMITKNIKEEDDIFLETLLQDMGRTHLGQCEESELKIIYTKLKERHAS